MDCFKCYSVELHNLFSQHLFCLLSAKRAAGDFDTFSLFIDIMLPPSQSGGPKGLGDPDDKSLRKVELEVLIPMKIREKTKKEKCLEEGQAFTECCKASGFWMFLKCRPQTNVLNKCLEKWYNDEEMKKQCTEEYLQERSEYRRTGITAKQRKKESTMF